jgi:hypothetical protein
LFIVETTSVPYRRTAIVLRAAGAHVGAPVLIDLDPRSIAVVVLRSEMLNDKTFSATVDKRQDTHRQQARNEIAERENIAVSIMKPASDSKHTGGTTPRRFIVCRG